MTKSLQRTIDLQRAILIARGISPDQADRFIELKLEYERGLPQQFEALMKMAERGLPQQFEALMKMAEQEVTDP